MIRDPQAFPTPIPVNTSLSSEDGLRGCSLIVFSPSEWPHANDLPRLGPLGHMRRDGASSWLFVDETAKKVRLNSDTHVPKLRKVSESLHAKHSFKASSQVRVHSSCLPHFCLPKLSKHEKAGEERGPDRCLLLVSQDERIFAF